MQKKTLCGQKVKLTESDVEIDTTVNT